MNIKQAERLSGVSRRNIRYYEQEGMINPARNRENDYREYTDEDIEVLKQIRILRMVDMPLEQIRDVLQGKKSLSGAAAAHLDCLQDRARELESAIRFCRELSKLENMDAMDSDGILHRMEQPENQASLFRQWVDDYKRFAKAQLKKSFYFEQKEIVSDVREMTMALFAYADENGLDMVITKEGMRAELTINGHEYIAERVYFHMRGVPLPIIQFTAVHPEEFDCTDMAPERKGILKWVWLALPYLCVTLVYVLLFGKLLTHWSGWVALPSILVATAYIRRYGWYGVRFQMNRKKDGK